MADSDESEIDDDEFIHTKSTDSSHKSFNSAASKGEKVTTR
jgi:hypothetical protein